MGYNKEIFRTIKNEFSTKYLKAQEAADARRSEAEQRIPELVLLHRQMNALGLEVMGAVLNNGDPQTAVEKLQEKNQAMQKDEQALLTAHGYPADYLEIRYECPICGDTGYVDCKMCTCMKKALIQAEYQASGLGTLLDRQTFDNFDLDFYRGNMDAFGTMQRTFEELKKYAENFAPEKQKADNLLLMGGTGLGKTHLSTALAGVIIGRGYDVRYASAVGLLADFERERFGSSTAESHSEDIQNYYDCDLLIIDDLGTEVSNQFTVSSLHNLLNVRLNRGFATVISTNLSPADIRNRYWDRITSRLLGEFRMILFRGVDVRMQKIRTT